MTRTRILLLGLMLIAGVALAGCAGDEQQVNEDTGPGDETGDITDDEDTMDGQGGTGEQQPEDAEGADATGAVTPESTS